MRTVPGPLDKKCGLARGPHPQEQTGEENCELGHSRPSWLRQMSRRTQYRALILGRPHSTGTPFCYLSVLKGHFFLIHAETLPVLATVQAVKTMGSLRLTTYFRGEETKAQRGKVTCLESHGEPWPDAHQALSRIRRLLTFTYSPLCPNIGSPAAVIPSPGDPDPLDNCQLSLDDSG